VCQHGSKSIRLSSRTEVGKTLCDIAECNAKKVHGKKSIINVINVSAEEYDYRIGTVYYLFNPFGASTLNAVLAKMKQAVRFKPRKLRIVHVNSVHDLVLNRCDWLKMYDRWEAGEQLGLMHNVSFWCTKDLKNVI
jgi:hypothetical protein